MEGWFLRFPLDITLNTEYTTTMRNPTDTQTPAQALHSLLQDHRHTAITEGMRWETRMEEGWEILDSVISHMVAGRMTLQEAEKVREDLYWFIDGN
jgi:hypothetical protein